MYERQHGNGFEIGSYAHRAILMDADDIPSIAASALSPTMLPFTQEDFDPQLEDALELFPEIVGDESVGVKLAINGLLSLTPGRQPDHRRDARGQGPLVARPRSGSRRRPGSPKTIAEWMTNGEPEIDPHGSDIARFYDHHKTAQHIAARTTEGYNKTYGIVHPMEQWASNRPIRLSPAYERQKALGAEFFEAAGWERPYWYERERAAPRASTATGSCRARPSGSRAGGRRSSTPSTSRCATGSGWSTCRRSRSSTSPGPGACAVPRAAVRQQGRRAAGRTVYTPLLNGAGGILADLTIMRLGHDRFRVVTGGGMGMRDKKLFTDALPADGSAQLHDATNQWTTIGLWGPRARDVLAGGDRRTTSATPASRS